MSMTPRLSLPTFDEADAPLIEAAMAYLSDERDAETIEKLNALLAGDAQRRERFAMLVWHRRMMIETLTRDQTLRPKAGSASAWGDAEDARSEPTPTLSGASPRSVWYAKGFRGQGSGISFKAAIAALVALAAALVMVFVLPYPQSAIRNPKSDSAAARNFAILSDVSADARFADAEYALGSDLSGPIRLAAGTAQVMFRSTAVADLIGPGELAMTGSNRGRLASGTLSVYVPAAAHGFTLDLPGGASVVDLGTRFVATVDELDRVQVRVLAGRVLIREATGAEHELSEGALTALTAGRLSPEAITLPVLCDAQLITSRISPLSRLNTFKVAADDLLQTAAATRELGEGAAATGVFTNQSIDALTDGPVVWDSANVSDTHGSWSTLDGGSITWHFSSDDAPWGYDIDRIESLTGCWPNRDGQVYSVLVRTIGDAAFVPLTEVRLPDNSPDSRGVFERQVVVESRDGRPLARGIVAVRFVFHDDEPFGKHLGPSVYRELDVIGRASKLTATAAPSIEEDNETAPHLEGDAP
ncbi:MAG: hypothetical protein GC162_10800 [Planctomycetes bacterium]|nr:hypothetical protein [Planctomycetota bacterium]